MTVVVNKAVVELFVGCSLPQRPDAIAASDNCNAPATTVVEMANGNLMYRCEAHRGIRRIEVGPVRETVPVEERDKGEPL